MPLTRMKVGHFERSGASTNMQRGSPDVTVEAVLVSVSVQSHARLVLSILWDSYVR